MMRMATCTRRGRVVGGVDRCCWNTTIWLHMVVFVSAKTFKHYRQHLHRKAYTVVSNNGVLRQLGIDKGDPDEPVTWQQLVSSTDCSCQRLILLLFQQHCVNTNHCMMHVTRSRSAHSCATDFFGVEAWKKCWWGDVGVSNMNVGFVNVTKLRKQYLVVRVSTTLIVNSHIFLIHI